MPLPFFRKPKDKDPPTRTPARPAPVAAEPDELDAPPTSGLGIVVQEAGTTDGSPLEAAALAHARGDAATAERVLQGLLAGNDRRAWLMLLDLYAATGREAQFERLALDYAVRFETSPPVWTPPPAPATATATPDAAALAPAGLLNEATVAELRHQTQLLSAGAEIRLDLARIELVDEAGASACAHWLDALLAEQRPLVVAGIERLISLLADLTRATHSRPAHWRLLMTLYQIIGNESAFEEVAVDYAVRFEISPPSWQTPAAGRRVQLVAAAHTPSSPALAGDITPANLDILLAPIERAQAGSDIDLDLSAVTRIDDACASALISTLMQALGRGVNVRLTGHSLLLHTLFASLGIDQLAQLGCRHRL